MCRYGRTSQVHGISCIGRTRVCSGKHHNRQGREEPNGSLVLVVETVFASGDCLCHVRSRQFGSTDPFGWVQTGTTPRHALVLAQGRMHLSHAASLRYPLDRSLSTHGQTTTKTTTTTTTTGKRPWRRRTAEATVATTPHGSVNHSPIPRIVAAQLSRRQPTQCQQPRQQQELTRG